MVSNAKPANVTSLGRNGLYDWVIQRVSAIIVGLYFIGMLGYLMAHPHMEYATWSAFMGSVCMQVINTIVFFMIAAHAWVGVWTVTTDYLTGLAIKKHATGVRLVVQVVIALLLTIYLLLGLHMIWGGN
jgi:succinate dehydrogenase / fumarate reductase membrane anchor subunit